MCIHDLYIHIYLYPSWFGLCNVSMCLIWGIPDSCLQSAPDQTDTAMYKYLGGI